MANDVSTGQDPADVAHRQSWRDPALDIVKGACVVVMVLYHTIEYFPDSVLDLKYLSFVTGAFILLAGFVITNIYLEKYDLPTQWGIICRRLGVRGIKLILLAVILNVFIALLLGTAWKQRSGIGSMLENLLFGTNHRAVSFYLLVLIGYSLLITAIFLAVGRGRAGLLLPVGIASLIYAVISSHFGWPGSYYVRLVAIGQIGAALGLVGRAGLMAVTSRLDMVLVVYFLQLFAMVMWPPSYLLYVFHLICTVLVIYCVGSKCNPSTWICRKLVLLGKYSLLGYLFQIAFLQFTRRVVHFTDEGVLVAFILATAATVGCIMLTERIRRRSRWFEEAYKNIFQ